MKEKILKILSVFVALVFVISSFAACSNKDSKESKKPDISSAKSDKEKSDDKKADSSSEKTKYGKSEVYNKDGKNYAKTDDGQEVELSGENMQKLLADYEKVKGTGSDEEKDILNKLQVILEAPRE